MWDIIFAALVLGPGAFILGRWQYTDKTPTPGELLGVLVWTYVMLFIQFKDLNQIQRDHAKACRQLENRLKLENQDDMIYEPEGVDDWESCYRYTDDYADRMSDGESALSDH